MKHLPVMETIYQRRSAREFLDTPVPDAVLYDMTEAARHAPSPGNSQRYHFGIIKDPQLRTRLAHAAGRQLWIAKAPVIIACCADISWDIRDMPTDDFGRQVNILRFGERFIQYLCDYPDRTARTTFFENATPLLPAEHMVLAAAAHEVQSCFVGYLDITQASRILKLPETVRCLFLLPVGYAAKPPAEKTLKDRSEILFTDTWTSRA